MAQTKKEVIWNLQEYADKIFLLVASESGAAQRQLVGIIKQAENEYKAPLDSWVQGWVYRFTRQRVGEIDTAITQLEGGSDAFHRVLAIKELLSKGEWKQGSFNYDVFMEFIKVIPGYNAIKERLAQPVIEEMSKLVVKKLDQYLIDNKALQEKKAAQALDLQAGHQRLKKAVEGVFICNDLPATLQNAKNTPANTLFYLRLQDKKWKFSWVDAFGSNHQLEPNAEMLALLTNKNITNIIQLKEQDIPHLKEQCLKVKAAFLSKVRVFINAEGNEKSQEAQAAFVLSKTATAWALSWVSTMGVRREINLSEYPALQAWLAAANTITEEQLPELKMHLLRVNTTNSLQMTDFKSQLSACLTRTPVEPPKQEQAASAPSHQLDMSKFTSVAALFGSRPSTPKAQPKAAETPKPKVQPPAEEFPMLEYARYGIFATVAAMFDNTAPESQALDYESPTL